MVGGSYRPRTPQSRIKMSSPHSGTLVHLRKPGEPGAAPGGTTPTASPNFPSLGFPLPRATSTAIPRPHRRRASSRRHKPSRTRRPGVREAGVAPPHAQPWPPLGTSTPQGLPLPFTLTRQAARKKAEAAPLWSRPQAGWGEEVAGGLPAAPLLGGRAGRRGAEVSRQRQVRLRGASCALPHVGTVTSCPQWDAEEGEATGSGPSG